MKVQLMQVGDRLSLELDPAGWEAVRSFIKQTHPDVTTQVAGIATLIRFHGSQFIFENEWDAPYLLAETAAGDDLLKAICNQLG